MSPPPAIYRSCDQCNRQISGEEWIRNVRGTPPNDRHYCDNCYAQILGQMVGMPPMQINCPKCGSPVDYRTSRRCANCGYKINPMRCPRCHIRWIDREENNCVCGWVNPNPIARTAKSLKETTGKKLNVGKIYEMMIYELAGIFVIFGLPFFGIPSMPFLGVVLMVLFPFFSFLPSEHEALASRERGVESLGAWAAGALLVKGIVKLFAFILTVMQFIILPVSRLIPLAISFIYYFFLPTSYKVTQPFQMIEAWFRVGVGVLIAWFMLMAFASTSQAWSLALMSAAFFVTSFPRHKEAEEEKGVVRVEVLDKAGLKYLKGQLELPLKFLFSILMIAAWAVSGIGFGTSSIQIIFAAIWFLSFFSGWVAGSEGRPALGILMIGITLFVFTFTATGVMGQAVFGYWWPQVEAFGTSIVEPLAPMWEQVQSGMGDAWLILTNPMGYYDIMQKRTQATKSVVKEGGTTKSIELTKTDLFTSVTGELEPRLDPLIGSFEIQNQGEFDANRIKLDLWASWQDPLQVTATNPLAGLVTPIGHLSKFDCSKVSISSFNPGDQMGYCTWEQTTYPQEMRFVNFMFEKNSWDLTGGSYVPDDPNLNICVYNGSQAPCTNPDATYAHSGQTVKVNVNLTYDYSVNVSIPVEVIDQDKYRSLLQARQITLQELTSQYTGGPVKATLWSQKQPVRDKDEVSLFVASIINEGGGTLNEVREFKVKIPKELADQNNIEIVAQTFKSIAGERDPTGCGDLSIPANKYPVSEGDYWVIKCVHKEPMKTGEYKRVSFFITPRDVTDRKTSLIVGLANYEYIKTGSTTIKVANAPWH